MDKEKIIVTGGAGFIGSNVAEHFLEQGREVCVLDNLDRPGVGSNIDWLMNLRTSGVLRYIKEDIRDGERLKQVFKAMRPDAVFHLAAQTAVTASVADPRTDLEVNVLGTVNVLEAARSLGDNTVVVYSSTNKVYGDLKHPVEETETRYKFADYELAEGIDELQPLDFKSPYGCSKGAADQYVLDYYATFGLPTVSVRQSCIYGPRQFGSTDQGWVCHFVRSALDGNPIIIYGDGKQVRDVLDVSDLVRFYGLALENIDSVKGQAFNVGGGPENILSLNELVTILRRDRQVTTIYDKQPRTGDQKVYISDITKANRMLGWNPEIGVDQGLDRLVDWAKTLVEK